MANPCDPKPPIRVLPGEPEGSSDHLPVTLMTPGEARQPCPVPPWSASLYVEGDHTGPLGRGRFGQM